ncbi:MAG: hypothetical protein EOM50_10885, partial [Erysipelotrichia bacterium]|nr:hypothetical protein [Erysipelotrichia bacterium]
MYKFKDNINFKDPGNVQSIDDLVSFIEQHNDRCKKNDEHAYVTISEVSENGEILEMYSAGHQLINDSTEEVTAVMTDYIKQNRHLKPSFFTMPWACNKDMHALIEDILHFDNEKYKKMV